MRPGHPIERTTAVVTGANRGIGRALTEALLERGAARVYATARDTRALADLVERNGGRLVPVALDVTDDKEVRALAARATDAALLVNNAGVAAGGGLSDTDIVTSARREMEVNYFAPLNLLQRLLPALARNGGTVVNISSVAGLTAFPMFPTYSASKAAVHSLTQAARLLLAGQGVRSIGVYPGPVDTEMAKDVPFDKASPADVARAVLDGVEAGAMSIYPDAFSADFGRQFENSPVASERRIGAMLAESAS
jgi:NAD(P)-dependent dehydrogenase (short-subunit alcohol dehydrogenase family)